MRLMSESVQECSRKRRIAEDPSPIGKPEIGGDDNRAALVTLGQNLKQQLGGFLRGQRGLTKSIAVNGVNGSTDGQRVNGSTGSDQVNTLILQDNPNYPPP